MAKNSVGTRNESERINQRTLNMTMSINAHTATPSRMVSQKKYVTASEADHTARFGKPGLGE